MNRLNEIEARANAATEGPWEETWKPIPGYDGYEVSDFGNVRSLFKKGNHKEKRSQVARLLKAVPGRRGGGYQTVSIKPPGGNYRHHAVHRLVMLAFVGPCPEGMEVAHLNGDNTDARLSNLAYVTHRENESHKREHGTLGMGERNSQAKLQGWQVAEIKYLAGKSVPQGKIAALFDIDHKQVSAILNGTTWEDQHARADVPDMAAALRAVLEIHQDGGESQGYTDTGTYDFMPHCCTECGSLGEYGVPYPCPTVTAIRRHLGDDL